MNPEDENNEQQLGHAEGTCPKCKGLNINYDKERVEDDYLLIPGTCADCGTKIVERFYLDYVQTEIIKEN